MLESRCLDCDAGATRRAIHERERLHHGVYLDEDPRLPRRPPALPPGHYQRIEVHGPQILPEKRILINFPAVPALWRPPKPLGGPAVMRLSNKGPEFRPEATDVGTLKPHG